MLHYFSVEEFNKLITLEDFKNYINNIKDYSNDDIKHYDLKIVNGVLNINVLLTVPYYYKYTIYYKLYKFITDYIINNIDYIDIINQQYYRNHLMELTTLNKGQILLKKFNITNITYVEQFIETASYKGTLPTFLFWLNKCNNINHLKYFINSCSNTDNRILDYYLKNKNKYNLTINKNTFITIINKIVSSDGIPEKYVFRRLKKINTVFDNSKYYPYMIDYMIHYPPTYLKLMKYYYTDNHIFNKCQHYCYIAICGYMNNAIDEVCAIFKYINHMDKNHLFLILVKCGYNINHLSNYHIFNNNYNKLIIEKILSPLELDDYIYDSIEDPFLKFNISHMNENRRFICNLLKDYKFSNKFYKNIDNKQIVLLLYKYLDTKKIPKEYKCINVFIKLYNKLYTKKKIKKLYDNVDISINKYIFTKTSPSHLTKNKLSMIENKSYIKPKADGITVYKLPNCYPNDDMMKYNLIAEYIEHLDLYLVFDIDIDKPFHERYRMMRSMHPYIVEYDIKHILSLNDLKYNNIVEDNNMKKFLKSSYKNYRWYPKVAYTIDKKCIMDNINTIMEKDIYNTTIYPTDGYVVINTNNKYKIKPKEKLTIDIMYRNNNWYDRENNIVNNIITINESKNNMIWRCYPKLINNKLCFENREIRFDKKKSNPRNVINEVIMTFKGDENIYYQYMNKVNPKNLKSIVNNRKHFELILNKYNVSGKILDIGCGKAKILNYIKPKLYFGIDNNAVLLSKNINKYNKKYNIIFKNVDMNKDNILCIVPKIKFDYIILNFTINHFYNNIWNVIENYTNNNTKIIFNITNDNIINKKINLINGYIKSDGKTTEYLFPWCQNNIVMEQFISKKQLHQDLSKYNYNINEIKLNKETELEKIYDWYILSKTIDI